MTSPEAAPRTRAGRALLADFEAFDVDDFDVTEYRKTILAIEAEAAAAPAEGLREALLRLVDEHAFIDYPTPRCDCEEWPAKGDTDKHWDEHFATVAAAALARHEPEAGK